MGTPYSGPLGHDEYLVPLPDRLRVPARRTERLRKEALRKVGAT